MTSVAPAGEEIPLNADGDFEIDTSKSCHVVESWKHHRVTLVCAIKLNPSASTPTFSWNNTFSNKEIKRGKHKDKRDHSVLRFSTKKEKDFGTYLCTVENDSTKRTHEIDIKRIREPEPPMNIRYELHSVQDKAHLKVRVLWDAPENNGGAPIIGYIVKRKTRAGRWHNTRRMDTPAQKRSMLIKIKERKRYMVRVIAVNKVGWSEPNTIELEETIPEERPKQQQPEPVQIETADLETAEQETGGETSTTTAPAETKQEGQVEAQKQKPEINIPEPFSKSNCDALLSLENEEAEDWELLLRSDDAQVEVWKKENSKPSLFKINLLITNTAYVQVVELMTNWEKRQQWDKTLASFDIVEASEAVKTVQLVLDMPTCYNKRELLINSCDISLTENGEQYHMLLCQETTHDGKPAPKNCCKGCYCCCCDNLVRANMLLSGIIIRPSSEEANSVSISMLMHTDFNGCCAGRAAKKYFIHAALKWHQVLNNYFSSDK